MGLNAGDLRREIVIETALPVQSDSGEEVFDWDGATDVTIWAQWLPADTTEAWRAAQRLASYIDGVFRIYDRSPRPTPHNTRIVMDGRSYDIKAPIEIEDDTGVVGLEIAAVARGE